MAGALELEWEEIFSSPVAAKKTSLGVNFLEASKPTKVLPLVPGVQLELSQSLEDLGIAGVVWDCGVVLARALSGELSSLVRGKQVLDLGCGGGAPAGLAAAACGAREVTLSDLPLVRPLVEANMAANLGVAPNCHFAAYEWPQRDPQGSAGERSREEQHPPHGAPFDVVLCADCMYDTKILDPLLAALTEVSAPGKTTVVLAYKRRVDDRERPFFKKLSQTWTLRLVPRSAFDGDFPAPPSQSPSTGQSAEAPPSRPLSRSPLADVHLLVATRHPALFAAPPNLP
mmetsp:Transcript_67982/g.153833  ORF Transcript_67982/g.153833 Transcript_67982/m.153833 type:complete len:286 (+) Transcript_67982:233-1090(+)|eukprot:CAMPEP_0172608268 /NCGR_PEP_ID=MMETSP1068-20121228/28368_1 /TAXON_ID=35684 /ORGANISM="Pseudopedinella elastica, Strain CCMP716" /LENGTH=285 /DNA_ID=CAMNT_0013411489 /DNA_START=119 /DNA_END=976 /DNA_ORIENTATION=-